MNPAHIIYAIAAVAFVCGLITAYIFITAPEGYEDETGFHVKDKK